MLAHSEKLPIAAVVDRFVEIAPHVSVSDFVRCAKGRSSSKIQQKLEHVRKWC